MFFSKLVGTPRREGGVSTGNEFTPIGARSRSQNDNTSLPPQSRYDNRSRALFPPDEEITRLASEGDYMFDDTHSQGFVSSPRRPLVEVPESKLPSRNKNLVTEYSSVKDQNERQKALTNENYLLRFEVVTLKKLLEKSPEKLQFYNEKMQLQQQLAQAKETIEVLRSSDKENDPKELKLKDQQIFELKSRLDKSAKDNLERNDLVLQLQERDREVESLRRDLMQLSRSKAGSEADLKQEIRSKQEQIDRLQSSLANNDDQANHRFQQELERKAREIKQLELKLDFAQKTLQEKDAHLESRSKDGDLTKFTIDKLNRELSIKENKIENLSREIDDLRKSSSKTDGLTNSTIDKLNRELSMKDNKIDNLSRQIGDLRQTSNKADGLTNSTIEKLNRELSIKDNEIDNLSREINDLRKASTNNTSLARDFNDLNSDFRQIKSKYQSLIEEHKNMENSIRSTKEDVFSKNQLLRERDDEIEHLKSKIQDLDRSRAHVSTDKDRQQILALKSQIDRLRNELQILQSKSNSGDEQLNDYQKQIHDYRTSASHLQSKIDSLTNALRIKDKDEYNLRSEIDALKNQNNSTNFQQLNSKDEEIRELTRKARDDAERIEFYETEHKKLEENFEQLKQDHDALLATERKLRDEISSLLDSNSYQARAREPPAAISSQILDESLQNFMNENSHLRQKLSEAETRIIDLKFENGKFLRNRLEQDEEIRRLTDENDQIRNSLRRKSRLEIDQLNYELNNKEETIKNLEFKMMNLQRALDNAEIYKPDTTRLESKVDFMSKETRETKEILNSMRLMNLGTQPKQESNVTTESPFLIMMELQLKQANEQKDEISKRLAKAEELNQILEEKQVILERDIRSSEKYKSIYESKAETVDSQNEKLTQKVKRLERDLLDSSDKIDKLLDEMKSLNRVHENKQNHVYDEELRQARMDKLKLEDEISTLRRQIRANLADSDSAMVAYLTADLRYHKTRLAYVVETCQNLYYKYTYMTRTNQISNKLIKDEIKVFSKYGIYPDDTPKKKLTFAVVAKLVRASIRFKNRYEKGQTRNSVLRELKLEIEQGKAQLNL